jgi:hypothetical protein
LTGSPEPEARLKPNNDHLRMCYCMCMLDHRVQILLDDARYQKVAREALRRGVSIAAVIRDALDRLPADAEVRRTAVDAILAAEPMPVPADPAELRRELETAHDRLER